jgi:hypothetical protein
MSEVEQASVESQGQTQETTQETVDTSQVIDSVLKTKNEVKPDEKKEVAAPKEEPKKEADPKMAAKFAALTKRERELRLREKAIAEKEKAAAPKADEPKKVEEVPLKLRMKKDPFQTLKEEFGLDLETLTQIAKNEGKLTSEMQLRIAQEELDNKYADKLAALEKRLAEKEESEKSERQQAAEAQAFNEFKGSIDQHIKADVATYELLSLEDDAAQIVYDVIAGHYEATKGQADPEQPDVGRILSIKEAADQVENHLLENAKRYTSLSKIKGLLAPEPAKVAAPATKEASKTLSNEHTGEAPPATNKRVQTREEELAEAMKLIKFQE